MTKRGYLAAVGFPTADKNAARLSLIICAARKYLSRVGHDMEGLGSALKALQANIGWIFATAVDIITHPSDRFSPGQPRKGDLVELANNVDLTPRVWMFGVLGIIGGTLLFGASTELDLILLTRIIVATLVCWIIFALLMHGLCKLLGGKSSFTRTLSVSIQVLAMAFFLSSFVGFISGKLFLALTYTTLFALMPDDRTVSVFVCFGFEAVFLLIYWTLGLQRVHGLRWWSAAAIPFAVVLFMLINFAAFAAAILIGSFPNGFNPHT